MAVVLLMAGITVSEAADRLARHGIAATPAEAEVAAEAALRTVAAFGPLADKLRSDAGPEAFTARIEAFRGRAGAAGPMTGGASTREGDPEMDVAAAVERAEEVQRRYNAFIEVTADAARETVGPRVSSAAAEPRGPLFGRPFVHKDVFVAPNRLPTAGVGHGHRWKGPPSTTLAALDRAGAINLGATNLDSWCYVPLGLNDFFGRVQHPLGADLLTGGSSSGSAVAVATGVVDFALGTDTGGSVRVPAALCGIYGLKTTHGLIHDPGVVPLSASQDTVGILGARPRDIVHALHAIAPGLAASSEIGNGGLIVGLERAMAGEWEAPVAAAIDVTIAKLRALGATVRDVSLPEIDGVNAAAAILTGFEAAALHIKRMAAHPEWYPDMVRQRILVGLLYEERDYRDALRLRSAYLNNVLDGPFRAADVILAPVLPMTMPRVTDVASPSLMPRFLRSNRPVNFLGLPALAIPTREGSGHPVGVQLIGRPFAEAELLGIAAALARS